MIQHSTSMDTYCCMEYVSTQLTHRLSAGTGFRILPVQYNFKPKIKATFYSKV